MNLVGFPPAPQIRGLVFRLITAPGEHFRTEYRTRDLDALLQEPQWGWSVSIDDAYVFSACFAPAEPRQDAEEWSAEMHVRALKAAGESHAHAMAFGEQLQMERAERQEATAPKPPAEPESEIQKRERQARSRKPARRVDPSETFEQLERQGLA